jgi:hypothetical protein
MKPDWPYLWFITVHVIVWVTSFFSVIVWVTSFFSVIVPAKIEVIVSATSGFSTDRHRTG